MLKRIGYLLTPDCLGTDLVGIQAVLGANVLRHRGIFVAETLAPVQCRSGMTLAPAFSFDTCPQLDVLVVGQIAPDTLRNASVRRFLEAQGASAKIIIGVASGVLALAQAGLLDGKKVTADRATMTALTSCNVNPIDSSTYVADGNVYTAGPATGAIEAAFAVMQKLSGTFMAKLSELTLEYHPRRRFSRNHLDALPKLDRLKVAVLVAPNMYLPDVAGAVETLGALLNVEFHFAGATTEPVQSILGPTVVPTTTLDACPNADVLVLGAHMPGLCADPNVLHFLRRQTRSAKAIIGICAGSVLLGAAGLLHTVKATSNFHMTGLLPKCGATRADGDLVVSGKFYTAGPAIGSYESALLAIDALHGRDVAAFIENEVLEYSPNPVFGVGAPHLAGPWLTGISRALVAPALPFYTRALRQGQKQLAQGSQAQLTA